MQANKLFYGDNKDILNSRLIADESVDLCYIDPPFNSKRNYNQIYNNEGEDKAQAQAFIDTWEWNQLSINEYHEITHNTHDYTAQTVKLIEGLQKVLGNSSLMAYLVAMTVRINLIWHKLKPTGSFYLHCDPTTSHYLKLVCDSIFCGKERGGDFLNEVIWKRTYAHNDPNRFGRITDTIFYYSKSKNSHLFNTIYIPYSKKYIDDFFKGKDDKGIYQSVILTGAGINPNDPDWHGYNPAQSGRHWSVPQRILNTLTTLENIKDMDAVAKLDLLDKNNYIIKSKNGIPRFKQYLHEMEGAPAQSLWDDISPIHSQSNESLGYPTQKPEALLERIITASSNEGDVVLDAFCGCGTTVAVAQRLNRQWIGIDITYQSISLILKRLEDTYGKEINDTVTLHGVPKDYESAKALAHKKDDRIRKEFEKWAILSYTNNSGMINEKKGADGGVDGRVLFGTDAKECIISVKSDKKPGDNMLNSLMGVMAKNKAACGVLILLEEPTKVMLKTAQAMGTFKIGESFSDEYPILKIVTIKDIVEKQERIFLPMVRTPLKSAKKLSSGEQDDLF